MSQYSYPVRNGVMLLFKYYLVARVCATVAYSDILNYETDVCIICAVNNGLDNWGRAHIVYEENRGLVEYILYVTVHTKKKKGSSSIVFLVAIFLPRHKQRIKDYPQIYTYCNPPFPFNQLSIKQTQIQDKTNHRDATHTHTPF